LTYPGDKTVTYGYDALNRMQSVADWLGGMAGYRYDAAGNLAAADNPNGTQSAYAYDDAERLIQLAYSKPDDSVLASYNLTLDAAGNRTAVDQSAPLAAVLAADAKVYDYDPANRVTAENGHSLSHDANGNLSGKDGIGFAFDFDDRLTGNGSTTYRYDGLGHRLETQRLTATTRYVHDLSHALPQLLMETDAAGNPLAYYVYGLGLLSRISPNDSVRYYHYDPLGNTVALTDSNGAVTDSYAYDPFGQVLAMQQSTDNPFRYVGQFGVMVEDNGLNYMRARYYSPGLGRFISKDPLTGTPGDSQSLNRYAYGLNNPVRFVDVSGLSAIEGTALAISSGSSDELHEKIIGKPRLSTAEKQRLKEKSPSFLAEAAYQSAYAEGLSDTIKLVENIKVTADSLIGFGGVFVPQVSTFYSVATNGIEGAGLFYNGASAEEVSEFAGGVLIDLGLGQIKTPYKITDLAVEAGSQLVHLGYDFWTDNN